MCFRSVTVTMGGRSQKFCQRWGREEDWLFKSSVLIFTVLVAAGLHGHSPLFPFQVGSARPPVPDDPAAAAGRVRGGRHGRGRRGAALRRVPPVSHSNADLNLDDFRALLRRSICSMCCKILFRNRKDGLFLVFCCFIVCSRLELANG